MRSRVIQQSFSEAPSWVVRRMAAKRDYHSSIGECEGCKRWKFRVVFSCVLVGFMGFLLGLEGCCGVWGRGRLEREGLWERRAQVMVQEFNLSKTQLQALAVLLSSSEREISERIEGPKTRSLSCLLEELCSEKKQSGSNVDEDAMLDTNNSLKKDSNRVEIVPFSVPSVVSDLKDGQIISNLEEFLKSTEGLLGLITENRLMVLLSVLIVMVLSVRILYHMKMLSLSNEHKNLKQLQSSSSKSGGKRKKLLLLGVLVGLSVSVWIFFSMNENIVRRQRETLENMCDERARMLQDQFNVSMNHVQALAILVSTFHHGKNPSAIDQRTFEEYTARTAFERPLTSGVAYALKVLHSEREQFEKEHGWKIKKMEREDQSPVQDDYDPEKLDPAPVEEEYAPVIFSQDTVSHIVSVDMMSGKDDRDNIIRSRTTGKGALTAPFNLLKYNYLGVVLTFAVYKSELPPHATPQERTDATIGYLGASFDVPSLVEKLLQQLASKQKIVVNVYDTTNSSSYIKMYGPDVTDSDDVYKSGVDFGDPTRKHAMHCRFKDKAALPWSAITTSIGVAVIVLLVGHIFYQALNRIEKVEDDYREMRELKGRAEAADVAKSQFLATVSHEIRTPMNGVLGMLQMLMDTELDATQQDFVMTAQESGNTLITLINEVLDQAKIESGRLELEAVPFDVRDLLDNVISLFSDKSQLKGIELAVYVSSQVPDVLVGDPVRFRQIITNLVGNSMKFTEEGHIFVSVHLLEEIKNSCEASTMFEVPHEVNNKKEISSYDTLSGFQVVDRQRIIDKFKIHDSPKDSGHKVNLFVTVEDTGVGIPEEAQSRIFTPFMQADSSTSRTYGGTGIGLSISKCLVELMGGEIGFVSKSGIGSTFSFTAVFEEGGMISGDVKRYYTEPTPSEFQGMRALVVDGRGIRAEIIKYHLQRLGVHVNVATDPKSALSALLEACSLSGRGSLDMVLVDKEAWSDGSALTFPRPLVNQQRKGMLEHWQKIPKLFLLATSLSSSEYDNLKSAGYIECIRKPLRLSMMGACLQKILGVVSKRQKQARGDSLALKELLKGKKILVVDDNAINRKVAWGALKKYGAVVTCVDSGKDAIRILRPPHEIDACFMDVQMPEMDGFEATRLIRSAEKEVNELIGRGEMLIETDQHMGYWHVPILAMTADVIQATYEECLRCGMDGYVSKPFEEQQLYSAVAHFLESDPISDAA
ncbi:hypothetical protein LUZ63_017798 [Rhynchospora breviuscula]|uniref:histidine kinase n=1 Tax=Rhynchospora breviuscula TaxID=2022672 RepID=A0A9Q0C354_9POAL|nr:hypothetical protein LUZ63_017798 [Rhynchospora breviuscula]